MLSGTKSLGDPLMKEVKNNTRRSKTIDIYIYIRLNITEHSFSLFNLRVIQFINLQNKQHIKLSLLIE